MNAFELRVLDKSNDTEIQFVFDVRTHPKVSPFLSGQPPATIQEHRNWINANVDEKKRWLFLCIYNRKLVGYAQIYNITETSLEVGWALHPTYHAFGVGTKAVNSLLHKIAVLFPTIPFVYLKVKEDNLPAHHVYTKVGFTPVSSDKGKITMNRPNQPPQADLEILYLGHAGFLLKRGNVRLLCDPWFYAAFYGSWYPYPYNRHLTHEALNPTHLYISHGHEDHYDKRFLSQLNKNIQVIAPNFKNKEMTHLLSEFKNTTFLNHQEETNLGDISIQMFIDVVSPKNDSAIQITAGDYKILNMNDCYLPTEDLPQVDMLWSQFSGAFHYPHCYDFDDATTQAKVLDVKTRYLNDLVTKVDKTKCSLLIPSAGPACFLDPSQEHLNDGNKTIFYPWEAFAPSFTDVALFDKLLPGSHLFLKDKDWHLSHVQEHPITLMGYRTETISERPTDTISVTKKSIDAYFARLIRTHTHLLKYHPMSFNLTVGEKTYLINLSPADAQVTPNYSFNVPSFLMADILNGGKWDAAFLSNRIKLHRDIDTYDTVLFQLLYADTSPERTREIAKSLDGQLDMATQQDWSYQKYCPHAGADLSTAIIENGVLECPRHNWKWDLGTGKCLKGSNSSLKVELMKLAFVQDHNNESLRLWNTDDTAESLRDQGLPCDSLTLPGDESKLFNYDVVIFYRSLTSDYSSLISRLQSKGKKVGFYIDDLLWDSNFSFAYAPHYKQRVQQFFTLADFCLFTSEYLSKYCPKGKPLLFRKAGILERRFKPKPQPRSGNFKILISKDHVIPAFKDFVTSLFTQCLVKEPVDVYYFSQGEKLYPDHIGRFTFHKISRLPFNKYLEKITEINPDLSLMPLPDDEFHRCKCYPKYLESGVTGSCLLASDIPPYNKIIKDGVNGLLATDQQFASKLKWAIEHRDSVTNIGHNNTKDVQENHLLGPIALKFYQDLVKLYHPIPKKVCAPHRDSPELIPGIIQNKQNGNLGEIISPKIIAQDFLCDQENLCRIDIFGTTLGRVNLGQLKLCVKENPTDTNAIRTSTLDMANLRDDDWFVFEFEPIAASTGRNFCLTLESDQSQKAVAISYINHSFNLGNLYLNNRKETGCLKFRVFYRF